MFHHPPYNGDTAQLGEGKNRAWCVTDPSLGVCLQNRGDVIIKVRDLEKAQDVAIRYCQPAKDGIIKRQDISKALPWSHHQVMDGTLSSISLPCCEIYNMCYMELAMAITTLVVDCDGMCSHAKDL